MNDAVLATRISKHYWAAQTEIRVLQDVSFGIQKGSSAALLGSARSGKTTLIKILAGLETLHSGLLSVFGNRLDALSETQRATYRREVVGLVSPEVPWLPQFSLKDNVALPLLIANMPRREADKRVTELCDWLGLPEVLTLNALTPLEQQRWALARALIHEPKLLLVDGLEQLDVEAESFIEEVLEKVSSLSLTVVFTTRQARVAAYGEQIFTLKESRLSTNPNLQVSLQ
jgi:putative ABC transport system ATP-binding protein